MADQINTTTTPSERSGSNAGLAFIVGALVVAVGVLAYVFFVGGADDSEDVNISIEGAGSAIEGAAESAGAAVEGAAGAVEGAAEEATDGN